MLNSKLLRHSIESVSEILKTRGFDLEVKKFQSLDHSRKTMQVNIQKWQHERNQQAKAVGLAKAGGGVVSQQMLQQLKALSESIKHAQEQFAQLQQQLDCFLASIPNIPHSSVPIGKNSDENKIVRLWGQPLHFSFAPRDHVELGARNQWMDFETASKLAGSRFVVLRGALAHLQRALIQFMLHVHTTQHGYQEISVPYIVNEDSLFGVGQLPKFKEDVFSIAGYNDPRYLISTAEVPVTNTVRDQVLEEQRLPIKYVCHSACFRSEAGSYGRDIRGMLRQHQFEKVELVQIVNPQHSYTVLEELTQDAEKVLQLLKLPYRVMALCTGDLGFASAKTYDLEVWLPSQQCYREISSCSNTESFQARRMKARYRDVLGNTDWVHTLNGSALAVGRTLVAILENYQDKQGRVHIPEALQPYMDHIKAI